MRRRVRMHVTVGDRAARDYRFEHVRWRGLSGTLLLTGPSVSFFCTGITTGCPDLAATGLLISYQEYHT